MALKDKVGTLAQEAVSTSVSAVRHPIGTASTAVGMVKGVAGAYVNLVRRTVGGVTSVIVEQASAPRQEQTSERAEAPTGSVGDDERESAKDVMPAEALKRAAEPVTDAAETVVDRVTDVAEPVVDKVTDAAEPVVDKVTDAAEPVVDKVTEAAEPVVDKVTEAAEPVVDRVAEVTQPVVEPVVEATPAPVKKAAKQAAKKATPAPAKKAAAKNAPAKKTAAKKAAKEDPRDKIPGPDLATFAPPAPEDLPEPIVIEAEPAEPAEPFHTEPKAATRESARGGTGDREENSGYVEEIPTSDVDIETPVGTTGAEVGTNPFTAESDLQQPGTPPLLDPSTIKAVKSETETLQKAADPDKG